MNYYALFSDYSGINGKGVRLGGTLAQCIGSLVCMVPYNEWYSHLVPGVPGLVSLDPFQP